MKWPSLTATVLLTVALTGCDRIPFLNKGSDEAAAPEGPAAAPTAATEQPVAVQEDSPTVDTPPVQQAVPAPEPEPAPPPLPRAQGEVPWTPTQTGTVSPGMVRSDVIAAWGAPVAERSIGEWTYLFYRNGCEIACGMYDVVFLQAGQVVDAVVRTPSHVYAGASSSPAGQQAQFTPPTRQGEMGSEQ